MSVHATALHDSQHLRSRGDASHSVYSKINWRIVPLLLIAYMVAYLDRINIGYAQLQMKETLAFGDAVYGLGAGIFFLGYFSPKSRATFSWSASVHARRFCASWCCGGLPPRR
jgi:sugar phosphate permease